MARRSYPYIFEPVGPSTAADLHWKPTYPDRIPSKVSVAIAAMPFLFQPPTSPVLPESNTSWLPTYPDKIDRLTLEADKQQTLAIPERQPDPPELSWLPEYPDSAPGPERSVALLTSFATVETETLVAFPDLSWGPQFPDQLLPARRPPEYPAVFVPGEIVQPPTVASWEPGYPDFTREQQPVTEFPAFFYTSALPQLPIPDLAWKPNYPDKIDRFIFEPARQQAFGGPEELVQPPLVDKWKSTYPDQLLPEERNVELLTGYGRPEALAQFPVPELSWEPEYPSFARSEALLVASQEAYFAPDQEPAPGIGPAVGISGHGGQPTYRFKGRHVQYPTKAALVEVVIIVPELAWAPQYPDILLPAERSVDLLTTYSRPEALAEIPPPELSWSPTYPDRIDRFKVRASDHPFYFGPEEAIIPPRISEWLPKYPDKIDRLIVTPDRQQFVTKPEQQPLPDGIGRELAVYPDRIDRFKFEPAQQQFIAVPEERIIPPRVSEWLPTYPDQLLPAERSVDLLTSYARTEALAEIPPPELSWAPTYPDKIDPKVSLGVANQGAFFSEELPIPVPPVPPLAWEPEYPSFARAPERLITAAQEAFVFPELLQPAPELVKLINEAISLPDITSEAVSLSGISSETISLPDITNETISSPSINSEAVVVPNVDSEDLEC